jgi:hypothetical protein
LDLATGKITDIPVFNGANNFDPQYSSDGKQVYFLSNRDGFRNMYRYTLADGKVEQMTDLFTGICGITEYSPAISISNNDDIVYSYYFAQKYFLYNAKASEFTPKVVSPQSTNYDAAMLPPFRSVGVDLINSNLNNFLAYKKIPTDSIKLIPYRPQFKLDYLASSGVGASISQFGAGISSGVQGVFSDILGHNLIYAGLDVNGQIYDFGGQFIYINQQGRWNFGVGVSHIPYQFGNYSEVQTSASTVQENYDIIRAFDDQVNLFTSYPLSKVNRIEFGTGVSHYYYRVDRYSTVYDTSGAYISSAHQHITNSDFNQDYLTNNGIQLVPFTLLNVNTALVGDNSYFGVASPLNGFRYRLQLEYDFGSFHFFSPTIDLRKYIRVAPVTFAGRLYLLGRFGNDIGANSGLYPQFLGYPFYIRGYEPQTFTNVPRNNFTVSDLSGNSIAVANFEVRLPFTGPEKLSAIKSKFFFSELNFFCDAGLAWSAGDKIEFKTNPSITGLTPVIDPTTGQQAVDGNGKAEYNPIYSKVPAFSTGVSLRVNMFGYFILEPYLAWPINRTDIGKPVFGLGFTPGW